MNRVFYSAFCALFLSLPIHAAAQQAQTVKGPDERFKTDILVVVAHPDDEAGVTPYLARAIYDEHKRVAVVYGTRGGSGGNEYAREHGPALADIREQEAREACARLGITHVWFLHGKDTASQDVLNSLASWGHGENLEELVRIVRLTRPEVIISWLPGIFIGEDHGDHQAAGVLATEAFDMADDPAAFPSQVAGPMKRLEPYLEGLSPWQPKKLYFFSDATDQAQFAGTGPAYSIKEISPSQKKPYWRLALNAAMPHLTQFPAEIQQLSKMSDEQLDNLMNNPKSAWWHDPLTLTFGKSAVQCPPTADVFACLDSRVAPMTRLRRDWALIPKESWPGVLTLGDPWTYYEHFYDQHGLVTLPPTSEAEIAVRSGSQLTLPLLIMHPGDKPSEVYLSVSLPEGWRVVRGDGRVLLPAEDRTSLRIEVSTPDLSQAELKSANPQEIVVHAEAQGKMLGDARLRVLLKADALPQ
jgi:LmbE family N-acetylglucosaminyl deacetylase